MNKKLIQTLLLLTLAHGIEARAVDLADHTYANYVDKKGEISLPAGFRQHWTHLGSWVVAKVDAPGYGFHDVYTQAQAVEAFKRSGRFPDGTVLVKEIRGLSSAEMTTGPATWAADPKVWFVMVKDDKNRFAGNRHWAEGWGWALFNAADTKKNVSTGFRDSCQACHEPARASDWVFVSGYPSLGPK
ncbi:cytochrome P460 family protein [Methylomonas sp. MgM2]